MKTLQSIFIVLYGAGFGGLAGAGISLINWPVFVGLWILCGVLEYGVSLAYYQKQWPSIADNNYQNDRRSAFWGAIFGPLALISSWVRGDFKHGVMYRRKSYHAVL